mmetsp:Transcript_24050/g.50296  ORF Transcript_24050/g.50296 Transcript_24050/m.50296 type:complete len:103 (+) Transcript_24050:196-504(+)
MAHKQPADFVALTSQLKNLAASQMKRVTQGLKTTARALTKSETDLLLLWKIQFAGRAYCLLCRQRFPTVSPLLQREKEQPHPMCASRRDCAARQSLNIGCNP